MESLNEVSPVCGLDSRAKWLTGAFRCALWGCLLLVIIRMLPILFRRTFLIYADEIEYVGSQRRQESVIGGAGTYAALGARLVAGAEYSGSVGWIVDIGYDFPVQFREMIELWRTSCLFREDKSRLTTKAWNKYGPGDHRC